MRWHLMIAWERCKSSVKLPALLMRERRRKHLRKKSQNPSEVRKRARRLSLDEAERNGIFREEDANASGEMTEIGNEQSQASFFRLPREVRDMVYQECADGTIWVIGNGKRGKLQAYKEEDIQRKRQRNPIWGTYMLTYTCPKRSGMALLPLLRTSRRMLVPFSPCPLQSSCYCIYSHSRTVSPS